MKFKVVSERLAGASFDQIVDSDEFIGCSIEALLDSGHIVPVDAKLTNVNSENAED